MHDDVDVIIAGAGPAGLAAAAALAESDLRVRLIDEQIGPGGQIGRNTNPPHCWPGVNYSLASTLVDIELDDLPSATWLQRKGPARIMHHTRARALILATGAMERPLLFPGCQLPGVMGVGAMQIMLKQAGLVPGGPGVIVAGQGPLMLLALQQVIARGGSVNAVLDLSEAGARTRAARKLPQAVAADPRLMLQGLQLLRTFRQMKVPVYKHVTALRAKGDGRVEEVQFESGGRNHTMPARLLALHDGVLPATQITRLLNLAHRWDERQQAFLPVTAVDGAASDSRIWVTGDAAGVMGAELASLRGRLTGLAVASTLRTGSGQRARAEGEAQDERRIRRRMPARHFVDELYRPLPVDHLATDDTIVCRCESISLKSIRNAIAIGASGPNRIKLFTRCGMGACQGRQCGIALTRIIAGETGRSCDEIGALRIRPPLKPTLIGDYTGDAT